jgi:hypothetical protein
LTDSVALLAAFVPHQMHAAITLEGSSLFSGVWLLFMRLVARFW